MKIVHWDRRKFPSYGGVHFTVVCLRVVFLYEINLRSAWACQNVRLFQVSALWMSVLKGFTVVNFQFQINGHSRVDRRAQYAAIWIGSIGSIADRDS